MYPLFNKISMTIKHTCRLRSLPQMVHIIPKNEGCYLEVTCFLRTALASHVFINEIPIWDIFMMFDNISERYFVSVTIIHILNVVVIAVNAENLGIVPHIITFGKHQVTNSHSKGHHSTQTLDFSVEVSYFYLQN